MPELPEVESARAVIERNGLRRCIVDVDDSDTYVCRPHAPGEIRHALLGGEFVAAMRQGKSMWCLTGPAPGAVTLGIHLGMSGKIVIADANGAEVDGGDYWEGRRQPGDYRWARFTVTFDDGGRLMLIDPRRLGRIRLNPPVGQLGPDAQLITPAQFRAALTAGGTAPVKARIMDQQRISGIGNLLADEILWRARLHPARAVGSLTPPEQSQLLRACRDAIRVALRDGGVHTLTIIPQRRRAGACPRDHAPMATGTIGGRTSWWCSAEQLLTLDNIAVSEPHRPGWLTASKHPGPFDADLPVAGYGSGAMASGARMDGRGRSELCRARAARRYPAWRICCAGAIRLCGRR
jgi:formamidopyrimidine-DNA glycosylase